MTAVTAESPKKGATESSKKVTFFSRFSHDTIQIEPTEHVQIGPQKFTERPGKTIEFHAGYFDTEDPAIIEALRARRDFGRNIFECGKPEHKAMIKELDQHGREKKRERFQRLGRAVDNRYNRGLEG